VRHACTRTQGECACVVAAKARSRHDARGRARVQACNCERSCATVNCRFAVCTHAHAKVHARGVCTKHEAVRARSRRDARGRARVQACNCKRSRVRRWRRVDGLRQIFFCCRKPLRTRRGRAFASEAVLRLRTRREELVLSQAPLRCAMFGAARVASCSRRCLLLFPPPSCSRLGGSLPGPRHLLLCLCTTQQPERSPASKIGLPVSEAATASICRAACPNFLPRRALTRQ